MRSNTGAESWHPGEFVITETGVEGGVMYAVSASLRDEILAKGVATLRLDLAPDRDMPRLTHDLSRPRGKRTMATHLQRQAHIEGVKAGLLREVVSKEDFADPVRLAAAIKSLPLRLVAPRPLEEAISTAGGVPFEALDARLMVRTLPGCLLCRRNVGLGGADRRVSADRLFRHWFGGGRGSCCLAKRQPDSIQGRRVSGVEAGAWLFIEKRRQAR